MNDAYTTFSRGDMDAVVDAMHPDIEWNEAEHSPWHAAGGDHGAKAVLTNVFARIPRYFESFEFEPRCFHDAGETVIVEGRYRASAVNTADPLDAQVVSRVDHPRKQAHCVPAIHRHLAVRPGHRLTAA